MVDNLWSLRKIVREILSDPTTWPDSTVNAWICAAIRDFSNYFSVESAQDINCVADQRIYSFAVDFVTIREVLRVEYPKDEEPPRYLVRHPITSPDFYGGPFYDLVGGTPPDAMMIGELPSTGETIRLDYAKDHTIPTSDLSSITVEPRHFEAIVLFCQWQAVRELEMLEAKEPDDSNIVLSMLGLNSGRAERLYRAKIREYKVTEADGGAVGPWQMDGSDRVY